MYVDLIRLTEGENKSTESRQASYLFSIWFIHFFVRFLGQLILISLKVSSCVRPNQEDGIPIHMYRRSWSSFPFSLSNPTLLQLSSSSLRLCAEHFKESTYIRTILLISSVRLYACVFCPSIL